MRVTSFVSALLATAMMVIPAAAGDYKFSVYGGANWNDVISDEYVDDKSGYVIGATISTPVKSVQGLSLQADLSFRQNEIDVYDYINVDHDTTALMLNGVYNLPVDFGPAKPYVLAGVGFANTQATFTDVALLRLESSGVAYQLGAGLETKVSDDVTAGIGYRYFAGPSLEVLGTELSDGTNHSLIASLTFNLN